MPRSDKKDTTCVSCGYKFTRPAKLCQHYQKLEKYGEAKEDPEAGPGPATQAHREGEELASIPQDIIFKECPVGRDLERPHKNRSLMSKWVGEVPYPEDNPAYAFNKPIFDIVKYREIPYIPQFISASRQKIKEVLQIKLRRNDQIKSAIVVKCLYLYTKVDKENRSSSETIYIELYHRGEMRPILLKEGIDEHITQTVGEIDKKVEEALLSGSGYMLVRILEISIEAYTLCQGTGGSHISTPKKLANNKSTINPDNKELIDPKTNKLSEECLKGALGCYFAH
ncbi:hypothetical protein RhiirC2_720983 [Rhizophagus irregularis]|uniref:Uncharacterized protein n=1 Tax=Rhizophagus irregularis TaxID=588596 RepID=A0A2N1M846_9GLOM|nr:hypothetical protein RhiirC2_720983 [Rhizophagus irregularis]